MAEAKSDQYLNNECEVNIRRGLDVIQSMIDISADRLEGLRTTCNTHTELTQQEIRTLETKLVKMFSELLITKAKLPERLPSKGLPATGNELRQWLRVVGDHHQHIPGTVHWVFGTNQQRVPRIEIIPRQLLRSIGSQSASPVPERKISGPVN
ncbi:uncharacterized protein LOC6048845 isoform X1 [Culex quinquefasciatus]|uniref:uncharacterized protein LOC6048845 isoform X1 n=1 Tax=Culex quinquefasciatus TaxID=7176 RepID=UPI0018E2B561|nr:uncharacterized protein LOC6048845 isoform X1 [Culex quinquefasciatus]